MSAKGGFKDKFYNDIAPIITGLGAAVVILGALFKIQHYPGASIMLIVGLGTEALLFIMFAFAPVHKDPDWTKVYPQLADDFDGEYDDEYEDETGVAVSENADLTGQLGDMLAGANVNQDTINRLGEGLNSLSSNVERMGSLTNAAVASEKYAETAQKATTSLETMSQQYAATAKAMEGMSNAAVDAGEYHTQVQNVTKNLSSLNAVYEMELQDANSHLKAMNKFHANLSVAMQNMSDASKDTEQFKQELSKLSGNLSQLNKVYGNMLTAMKG
ncbi:MAG: gliding motility protein GldL [Cytophagales bacterium]|nr:gliding motility protein GldL [Cytophagales bacterium]